MAQVKACLDGRPEAAFRVPPKAERYQCIEPVLKRFGAARDGWAGKGVLLRDIERMTRLLRQLVTRPPQARFNRRFIATDVALLAEMNAWHGHVSGPATRKLMDWAFFVFGNARFERLAGISVSHLCNLRGGKPYQNTRPTGVPIGQRRAPWSNGVLGYISIDSVHQGDQDGANGVYHINAVDVVIQFQLVRSARRSARRICSRSSGSCWMDVRLPAWDSTRTTVRSTSTTKSPGCWKRCGSSSPHHAPAF